MAPSGRLVAKANTLRPLVRLSAQIGSTAQVRETN